MPMITRKEMSSVSWRGSELIWTDEGSLLRAPARPLCDTDLVKHLVNPSRVGREICHSHRPWVPKHDVRMAKSHLPEMGRMSQTESEAVKVTLGP